MRMRVYKDCEKRNFEPGQNGTLGNEGSPGNPGQNTVFGFKNIAKEEMQFYVAVASLVIAIIALIKA